MLPFRRVVAVALSLVLFRSCLSCTYFEIRTEGVPTVIGNTNEWITPDTAESWKVAVQPRGKTFGPSCNGGKSWQSKLGFVGMTIGTAGTAIDTGGGNSMNEAGLSISEHALRGVGTYRPVNSTETLCAVDFGTWLVTTFETVAELREVLPSVSVLTDGPGSNSNPGSQWAVADAKGESIVVDHVAGQLHIYDNRAVGVLTNDPDYPWQVRNLNNYVGLSMGWPTGNEGIAVDSEFGTVPVAVGHGQNMLGLPGDLSPPARFVRTFFTRSYALKAAPPKHLEDSLVIASGVLNTQHILKGFNARLHTEHGYDYTQFGVMKVPMEKLFYYRTYEASQWRLVNLTAVDFRTSGHTKPSGGFAAIDVTSELQPSSIMNV